MQGPLTFNTVNALLAEAYSGDVRLDRVTQIDSAGLSFLLEIKRRAQARGVVLGFSEVPPAVTHLAKHFGVSRILGIQS